MTKSMKNGLLNRFLTSKESAANMASVVAMNAPVDIAASAVKGERTATFECIAYTGAPMKIEGWRFPTIIDLNGLDASRQSLPALRDHEIGRIVGHTTDISVSADGVRVRGVISGAGPDAQEVLTAGKNGYPWQVSLGSKPVNKAVEHLPAGKSAIVNGREVYGPMSIVRRASIYELSFTALGADRDTSAVIAATRKDSELMEDGNTITLDRVRDIVDSAVNRAVQQATESITATQARDIRLTRVCNGRPDILAKAHAENWSVERAELEVLRASRPKPMFGASSGLDGSPNECEVIEASLSLSAGVSEETLKDHHDEKVLNAAMSRKYRGIGLHGLMYSTIAAAGMHCTPGVVNNDMIRTAFEADRAIRASGTSNFSLSGTLSNVANKAVVDGFNTVEDTWSRIAAINSVKDFKQKTTYRLGGDFEYKEIGPNGELQHATMGETSYTNQAKTYGRIFGVSRTDLINDDLSAIQTTARDKLGRGAGLALNKVFWTEFMNNGSYFTSGRANYFEGAATNLQISSLTTAERMFFNQTDEDGAPTNLTPSILLVPNDTFVLANELTKSIELRDTTANTKYTTINPHAGKFTVERSAYLSNSAYSGNSTTAWYLLCDPKAMGVGVIEMVFLNGQQMPTIETSELDFDQLGIQMRGFHDFGCAKQEYRCGVKSKGAA